MSGPGGSGRLNPGSEGFGGSHGAGSGGSRRKSRKGGRGGAPNNSSGGEQGNAHGNDDTSGDHYGGGGGGGSGMNRGSRHSGGGGNKVKYYNGRGPRAGGRGAGGGPSTFRPDLSDEQAVHEFLKMLKEGGDGVPAQAPVVQKNYEDDGNRERYIRQVRYQIRDRVVTTSPPRPEPQNVGGAASGTDSASAISKSRGIGGTSGAWGIKTGESPAGGQGPSPPISGTSAPSGGKESPAAWGQGSTANVGSGHDPVGYIKTGSLHGSAGGANGGAPGATAGRGGGGDGGGGGVTGGDGVRPSLERSQLPGWNFIPEDMTRSNEGGVLAVDAGGASQPLQSGLEDLRMDNGTGSDGGRSTEASQQMIVAEHQQQMQLQQFQQQLLQQQQQEQQQHQHQQQHLQQTDSLQQPLTPYPRPLYGGMTAGSGGGGSSGGTQGPLHGLGFGNQLSDHETQLQQLQQLQQRQQQQSSVSAAPVSSAISNISNSSTPLNGWMPPFFGNNPLTASQGLSRSTEVLSNPMSSMNMSVNMNDSRMFGGVSLSDSSQASVQQLGGIGGASGGGMMGPSSSSTGLGDGGAAGPVQPVEATSQPTGEVWRKYFDTETGRHYRSNGIDSVWEDLDINYQQQQQQPVLPDQQRQQQPHQQQQQQQQSVHMQHQQLQHQQPPPQTKGAWNMPTSSRGSPLQHQHPSYQGNDGSGVLVGRNGGGVEASSAFMVSPATTLGHKSLAPMGAGLQLNSLGNSMQPVAGTGGMGPPGDFLVATGGDGAGGSGRVFGLQSSVQQQRQEWAGDIGNVSSDNTSSSGGSSNPPGLPSEWNNTTAAEAGHAQQAVMRPQQQQSNQRLSREPRAEGQGALGGGPARFGPRGSWGSLPQAQRQEQQQGMQHSAFDPARAIIRCKLQAGFNSTPPQQQQQPQQPQQQQQQQPQSQPRQQHSPPRQQQSPPRPQQQNSQNWQQQRVPTVRGDFPTGYAGMGPGAAHALHAKQTQPVAEHKRQAQHQQRGMADGRRGGIRGTAAPAPQQQHRQQQPQGGTAFSDAVGTAPGSGSKNQHVTWPAVEESRAAGGGRVLGGGTGEGSKGGAGAPDHGTGTNTGETNTGEADAEGKMNKTGSRFPPKRTVRNQVGWVYLTHPNGAADGGHGPPAVRPGAHISVRWEIPAEVVEGYGRPMRQTTAEEHRQQLMVGLFRLGVASNTAGIISKSMFDSDRPPSRPGNPKRTLSGHTPFYAPKSVGTFVFRLYDANNPVDTLATSHVWQVDAQGRDVELSVRFVLSQLRSSDGKASVMGALAQLAHLLNHLQTVPPQRYNRSVGNALWNAVTAARKQLGGVKIGPDKGGGKDSSKDAGGDDRKLRAVHGAVWCVLNAITNNPAARALLLEAPPQMDPLDGRGVSLPPIDLCMQWQRTYCPFEERYYDTPQALAKHYDEEFGFTPTTVPVDALDPAVLHRLTQQVSSLMPRILPKADFPEARERVRARLQAVLMRQVPQIPRGSTLQVFGSSSNGFGTDNADLDMCIAYADTSRHPEDAGALIEAIAEKLQGVGMAKVDSRPTARIPIVIFQDVGSGLECDISVMNPLAVRNTRLLKAYSVADPRVRELAYIVKHWAKRRWVNNASEGTLSSYGYLLCLVHFLQTRRPPVVPNLQALPPEWNGQELPPGFHHNLPTLITKQPTDGMDYNTYFFDPLAPGREGERRLEALRKFGSRNTASSGKLLAGFFRYFASELDCRAHVVSVRLGGLADRERKAETSCWSMHTRLSVEDPFETWYDVAHVLKWSRYKHVRMEFARAYALIANAGSFGQGRRDGAGGGDDLASLLDRICEQAEPPPFTRTEERASQEGIEDQAEQLRLEILNAQAH